MGAQIDGLEMVILSTPLGLPLSGPEPVHATELLARVS